MDKLGYTIAKSVKDTRSIVILYVIMNELAYCQMFQEQAMDIAILQRKSWLGWR